MSEKTNTKPRPRVASGWDVVAGRVVASARVAARPHAEDGPADPEKEAMPKAAEGAMKCPFCDAEVPVTDPAAKFCPSCGKELPMGDEPAAPPPGEAAAFAGFALQLTGAKSLQAARGTVSAWKAGAARYDAVAGELSTAHAELEHVRRERLLERAVAEGALEPSEAWSFSAGPPDATGQPTKIRNFSDWAGPPNSEKGTGQSLAQLTAYVREPRPGAGRAARPLTPGAAKPAAKPAPMGVNPEMYAAAAAQVAAQCGEGVR